MLLFSAALFKHKLNFKPLSERMEYLSLAATWAEEEWGYIRNKGVEFRKGVLNNLKEHVYIGTLNGTPVALFALFPKEMAPEFNEKKFKAPIISDLMYVYVDKPYRGLGFGTQIIEKAKEIAKTQKAEFIMLDTLKPSLNRFYKNAGAEVIAENQLFSHPTDVLTIRL
ncbi:MULTISPECIES: GNAT family N-acetyltransferase [Legionella]|uniref:GNAT family N-acetyltransferase n=1 Tax=Legionella resiliens TaxID=2905958 RepID=A0ABS8X2S1_9GAMM|nr:MULTISPECIES: GNAT family N-acetyltransferase [unclassified Legionella]MCE0722906.1 GNAT family N-acetyltransferase [Legionella sp. 9fVS26]MCE3532059.1 GNAT family N-acetyltransferase [Legionella sp. 8cVS16]QLZ68185.1 GNAT family N-acetyltransferase [Legionella sp. PC1000]